MESLSTLLQDTLNQLAAYPRWLVASCGVVVALAVLWLLSKVLKLTVQVFIACVAIAVVAAAAYWVLGYV